MSQVNRSMLVGDIGGTHARFAVVDISDSGPSPIHDLLDLDSSFECFSRALETYFAHAGLAKTPCAAAIAVAGSVTAGEAHFTNRIGHICESELKDFGFAEVFRAGRIPALSQETPEEAFTPRNARSGDYLGLGIETVPRTSRIMINT
jgi:glucokinase